MSLHHRGRDAESFGNLRLLQPCEAVEQKDIPPARRHFSDGLIQCASELIPLEQIIGQRSGGWGFLQFAEIDQETIADGNFPARVDGEVAGNALEKRPWLADHVRVIEREKSGEGFLHQVRRFVRTTQLGRQEA